jgi:hypothetical protein
MSPNKLLEVLSVQTQTIMVPAGRNFTIKAMLEVQQIMDFTKGFDDIRLARCETTEYHTLGKQSRAAVLNYLKEVENAGETDH